jgi:hypothetical protein
MTTINTASALVFNFDAIYFNATVRIVTKGQKYGLDFCLTHQSDEPLVEFYDRDNAHTEFGQFASRYYLSTLMASQVPENKYLSLVGHVEEWQIRGDELNRIRATISKAIA